MKLDAVDKPWGQYVTLYQDETYWTKILYIYPGAELSLQVHKDRDEFWVPLQDGLEAVIDTRRIVLASRVQYKIPKHTVHQIINPGMNVATVVEIATGAPDENDIERLSDKYGR